MAFPIEKFSFLGLGLLIHVDKRITLSAFKQHLEPFVGVPSSQFKVFRVYASNQEFESVRLNETLSSFSDDNKVSKQAKVKNRGIYLQASVWGYFGLLS